MRSESPEDRLHDKLNVLLMKNIGNIYLSLKNKMYHIWQYVLHRYDGRKSNYTRTGKIALCCIAKMENDYIRFFVEYYQRLHFDKIIIYDNNDPDGERFEDVINDYIQSGFVEIVDFRGRKVAQLSAYHDCYDRFNHQYDWIAFFDVDEFLTFTDGGDNIHDFLTQKKFLPYQLMHINWKVYGDNNLLDNDGRNVVERFVEPIPYDTKVAYDFPVNNHVKTIVRGGLSYVKWNKTPHTPNCIGYVCCNPLGESVCANSPFQDYGFNVAYIRHYSTKTIGEWVKNKMKRGIPDRADECWKECLNLDFFFRYNKKTEEKLLYAESMFNDGKSNNPLISTGPQ